MGATGRPPVNEVVLSVSFESQPVLSGPQLLVTLAPLFEEFPQVEEQMPYEMEPEYPIEEQIVRPQGPPVRFFAGNAPMEHRYWLTRDASDEYLIQVQSNYFALNWRDRGNASRYPGFDTLQRAFTERFEKFKQLVSRRSGDKILPGHGEFSYINLVRPDSLWASHNEIQNVLSLGATVLEDVEQFNLAYSRVLADTDGSFLGRVHTSAQTGYQPKSEDEIFLPRNLGDLSPLVNISLTARSAPLHSSSEGLTNFFDYAHRGLTAAFISLLTDAALEEWGLK
jgi:uncharacterized protein (TIGR04255 family)